MRTRIFEPYSFSIPANSKYADEMSHNVAFHQNLHFLQRLKVLYEGNASYALTPRLMQVSF